MTNKTSIILRILSYGMLLALFITTIVINDVMAEDLLQWDRVRLKADFLISQAFYDNIYLSEEDEIDDSVTIISPELNLDVAITEYVMAGFSYLGEYNFYSDAENFKEYNNFGEAYLKLEGLRKSFLKVGAGLDDTARQPYSEIDESKDYLTSRIFSGFEWKISKITSFGSEYEFSDRKFNESRYESGDNQRHDFSVNIVYGITPRLPLLLKYSVGYEIYSQKLNGSPELASHSIIGGFRWRPESRLSGTLGFGYFWTEFNTEKVYDGWTTDTDLTYKVGSFTDIKLMGSIGSRISDFYDRDTMDYYLFSRFGLAFYYSRFDPFRLRLEGDYRNIDYRINTSKTTQRLDDRYRASATIEYFLTKWLGCYINYRYLENQSDIDAQEYKANFVMAGLKFSI